MHKILPSGELLTERAELNLSNYHSFLSFSTYDAAHFSWWKEDLQHSVVRRVLACLVDGLAVVWRPFYIQRHPKDIGLSCMYASLSNIYPLSCHPITVQKLKFLICVVWVLPPNVTRCLKFCFWPIPPFWLTQTIWLSLPFTNATSFIYQKMFFSLQLALMGSRM